MKVTALTRSTLAARREKRDMERAGYRMHETDWEILRGYRYSEVITDVRISCNGKYVWTKLSGST